MIRSTSGSSSCPLVCISIVLSAPLDSSSDNVVVSFHSAVLHFKETRLGPILRDSGRTAVQTYN